MSTRGVGAPAGVEEVGQWPEGPLYEPFGLVHVLFEPRSGEKNGIRSLKSSFFNGKICF